MICEVVSKAPISGEAVPLSLKAAVSSRALVGDRLRLPGDAALIVREQPRWLILKCPCGCGDEIPLILDRRTGAAWRLYSDKKQRLTLFPSVWRRSGCMSHFIVRDSRIEFLSDAEYLKVPDCEAPGFSLLLSRVLVIMQSGETLESVDIAEALDEIPWDVLDACRHLVRTGDLAEVPEGESVKFRCCSP